MTYGSAAVTRAVATDRHVAGRSALRESAWDVRKGTGTTTGSQKGRGRP
ncbi:hypothetical protein ACFWZ2_07190 [Streptomyces sp. NPDC059002]